MKKILALLIAMMMVLSLAACGGNEENPSGGGTTDPGASQGSNDSTSGSSGDEEKADLTTVEGWLSYWGFTEDDLKPAHFTRLVQGKTNSDTREIKAVDAYVDTKLTEEEIRAWLEQVVSKLNSLSEDGKLLLLNGEELTVDYLMEQEMRMDSCSFEYKGKTAYALISVPGGLDNEDDDMASAACTLQLRH